MVSEFSDKSNHQQESALAGISDSILRGLTTPAELFTPSAKQDLSNFRESARDYLKDGLKTAAMFMRGKTGLISTIATQSLDEWKPADKEHQGVDLALGALKGAALTYIFRRTGQTDSSIKFLPEKLLPNPALHIPLQAAKLGLFTRIPSVGLSRSTYFDDNDKFDLARTSNILCSSAASIPFDVTAGIFTHGLVKGTNKLTTDAVARSPMLSTMLVGSGYGMSNGAANEILRQQSEQQHFDLTKFDYAKIAKSALLQGAIDSIAAIPGGHQAEREALKTYHQMDAAELKAKMVPAIEKNETQAGEPSNYYEAKNIDSDRCCMRQRKDKIKPVNFTPVTESLESLSKRIVDITKEQRPLRYYHEKSNELKYRYQYFVVHHLKDHTTEICVPSTFNIKLQDIRLMRRIEEKGSPTATHSDSKALPEDLIPHLDGLPNSTLVKEMRLLDMTCPEELQQAHSIYGPALASADSNGVIELYRQNNNPEILRSITNHEYAHLVSHAFERAYDAYACACRLEQALRYKIVNHRDYAQKSAEENFAVHFGEVLLDPSAQNMLKAFHYAPYRMAVLSKALHWTLNELPEAKVSKYREYFKARVDLLEKRLVPAVIKHLRKEIKENEPTAQQLRLLAFLGGEKEIKSVVDRKIGLNELSDYLMDEGKFSEAEPFLKEELEISEKINGMSHPITRSTLDTLVSNLCIQDKQVEAIPYLVRQWKMDSEKMTPQNWEKITFTLSELLSAYEELNHTKGQIHWLRQLFSHLDTSFDAATAIHQREVIQKLLNLLPESAQKERRRLKDKDKVLDIMFEAMGISNARS